MPGLGTSFGRGGATTFAADLKFADSILIMGSNMAETGTFTMEYNSNDGCNVPPQRPDWGNFAFSADTPVGTQIEFQFRTADTLAGLNTATPASVTLSSVTSVSNPLDIGNLLVSAGQLNQRVYLQCRAILRTNTAGTTSPALRSFRTEYTCVDAE